MNMKFNEIIEQTINNKVKDQETFEKDFKVIASLIENNKSTLNGRTNDNLKFSINLKKIVEDYSENYKSFSQKINKFLEDSQVSLDKLLNNTDSSVPLLAPKI